MSLSAHIARSSLGRALVTALALAACSGGKSDTIKGANPRAAEKPDPEAEDATEGEPAGDPAEEESLEDVIKQCGVKPSDLKDPDHVLLEKQIRSWPKVFVGTEAAPFVGDVNYKVKVVTKIDIKATVRETRQTIDFDIEATPSQALGKAREAVAKNRGSTTVKSLSTDERAALMGSNDDWAGVICTVQPAKELRTTKGGLSRTVRFNPPLPATVSPKADPKRYASEIGDERVFRDIEAEITASDDPSVPVGGKFKGTVRVRKINPTLILNIGGKERKEIKADAAYRVTYDFGGVSNVVALGLMPEQSFYISHSARDLSVIVAVTGTPDGGTVVLSPDL